MKKLLTLALMLVFATSLFAQEAPTVEEIAKTYIENMGGVDAMKAVKTTTVKGKANMQGMEFPITITASEGDMQHVEINVQGQKIIQAYDGETAWQIMPFAGITEPVSYTLLTLPTIYSASSSVHATSSP